LVYEVEINTKGQLQKRVTDAANQIRKNPEMPNSVYGTNGRHTEHLLQNNFSSLVHLSLGSRYSQLELKVRIPM
jgi:hypothetical protein